ncbi:hypothetical protein [Aquidulcibacter sp.]|uniref:hypothetical protein n=1 Tax=Aquidulcibacter sp. TaxID=2052990 RepID=UPI002607C798|nr:hypothetical protein [Aquidulcibacter sp.]MCE2892400.1 hypothetical protein [Hyphomonadaceae bacterium]
MGTNSSPMASDDPIAKQVPTELNSIGARYISVAIDCLQVDYARHHLEFVLRLLGIQS